MRLIHAYFKDIQQELLREILKSRSSIHIAVAWFTDQTLFDALLDKISEGVIVELIILKDKINVSNGGLDFQKFQKAGGRLFYKETTFMHHKFCVFDESILITGSYNWTRKAHETNVENILLIQGDIDLVNAYLNEFYRLSDQNSRFSKELFEKAPLFVAELSDTHEIMKYFQEETDTIELKGRYELEEKTIIGIQKENLIQLAIFYGLETKNAFLKLYLKGIIYYNTGQKRSRSLKYFLLASDIKPKNQYITYYIAKCQAIRLTEIVEMFGEWNSQIFYGNEKKTWALFTKYSEAIDSCNNFFWQVHFFRAMSLSDVYSHLHSKYMWGNFSDFQIIRQLVKQAYSDYSAILEHNNDNTYALYERASLINQWMDKKADVVIKDMTKLVAIAPDFCSYRAYLEKAKAYETLGMYQEAINEITAYLEYKPDSKYEFWLRGTLKIKLGLLVDALHDFDVALKINPDTFHVIDNDRINSERLSLISAINQKS